MTRVVVDTETWARLSNPKEFLEVCDQSGRTLVFCQPEYRTGSVADGRIDSPYMDDELHALQKQTGGRSLAEIMADLGAS